MPKDSLVVRARELWCELAREPVAFPAGAVEVVVAPDSLLCPRGWIGIVRLGNGAIASAPDEARAAAARDAFAHLSLEEVTDPGRVAEYLPLAEILGPAALAYLSADEFRPAADLSGGLSLDQLPAGHPDVIALEHAAGEADAEEAGVGQITSRAFAVRAAGDGGVVAVAGYRLWPGRTAHISVLAHPAWRGRRLARAAGGAAARDALAAGLLPQWRARVPASRRAAVALGFREIGWQLSVRADGSAAADGVRRPVSGGR